jgi:hypothetical protein
MNLILSYFGLFLTSIGVTMILRIYKAMMGTLLDPQKMGMFILSGHG